MRQQATEGRRRGGEDSGGRTSSCVFSWESRSSVSENLGSAKPSLAQHHQRPPTARRSSSYTTPDISTVTLHNGRRRKDPVSLHRQCLVRRLSDRTQIPQARLVAGRWLVRATRQLERQHCRRWPCPCQHRRHGLVRFRTARVPRQDARAGQVLPQPIVRHTETTRGESNAESRIGS